MCQPLRPIFHRLSDRFSAQAASNALSHSGKSGLKGNRDALLFDEEVDAERVITVLASGYAPDLNDVELERLGADPFLIACALVDPARRRVVTTEVSRPDPRADPIREKSPQVDPAPYIRRMPNATLATVCARYRMEAAAAATARCAAVRKMPVSSRSVSKTSLTRKTRQCGGSESVTTERRNRFESDPGSAVG